MVSSQLLNTHSICLFGWFYSLRPINKISVIKGRVYLGWTSTKLGLMILLKDTTQWRRLKSVALGLYSSWALYHWAPNTLRIFKRLAKTLIRLRVCAGWSEALLVAHTHCWKSHVVAQLLISLVGSMVDAFLSMVYAFLSMVDTFLSMVDAFLSTTISLTRAFQITGWFKDGGTFKESHQTGRRSRGSSSGPLGTG